MNIRKLLILTVLILGCITAPAMAGEKYLYGYPDLVAAISGTNEFTPGDEVTLNVLIENKGLNTIEIAKPSIISRTDLPNTAKMVKVTLKDSDAPFTVKSDSQMIGDIPGGTSKPASFVILFDRDAAPGVYSIPLTLGYTWLYDGEQFEMDTVKYTYYEKEITVPLNIRIKKDVSIDVNGVETDSINVGTEGYLTLKVKNTGHDNATKAVVKITRNADSPIVPTDASVYIGDFQPGSVKECTFKVSVSNNAEAGDYPLSVSVEYENEDGKMVMSDNEVIGIPTGGKIDFEVISDPTQLRPGQKGLIKVVYKNTGAAEVYNAQARISAVDPFSSNDDTAFLGNLAPGDTAEARFEVTVSSDGTIKEYGLDSEIRYRDALDNTQISDTMKVKVELVKPTGAAAIFTNPIVLTVMVFLILGAGYYVWSRRKQK